ncbi:protein mono-ADP-ribosyltransferase PARP12 [Chaetodon auriga]|uniref:protein mono-ADP-ribosyltransferase PARP12 n=1 Tax=Chaetodon auriga TaxID=39042 RepID=UPI004032F592
METEILKFICANQGSVDTDYLVFNLVFGDSADVSEIICNGEKFISCCPFGQPKVVARTNLRLCRNKACQGACRGLHLCKNILLSGSCQFTLTRKGCIFSHALDSEHNLRVLREHGLESLSRAELCTLLLQSDDRLLPPICYDYNNGDGEFGRCQDGHSCKRMHICEKYLNRECSCNRVHDFNAPQPLKSLRDKGVPEDLFRTLKSVYANIQALKYTDRSGDGGNRGNRGYRGKLGHGQQRRHFSTSTTEIPTAAPDLCDRYGCPEERYSDCNVSSDDGQSIKQTSNLSKPSTAVRGRGGKRGNRGNRGYPQKLKETRSTSDIFTAVNDPDDGPNRGKGQKPVRDKTEICMYFIKGHCIHGERCFKAHDKMPYRWEIRADDQWTAMPDNESIEKDYCDPKNTYSNTNPSVHFDTMTCGPNKVRRLSTINSLLEPNFILTTEWVWYWEDEFGRWNMYASPDGGHKPADMDSSKLEQKFLDNDKDVVEFVAGSQSYSLSFQDMIQANKQYHTKRVVRRRPRFVSAADVQTRRVRRPLGGANFSAVPDHWDKTQIPQTGSKRVSLQRSSDEYKEIEALFCKTMRGFDIVKIERIQNKGLWEVFQWQKTQMKNNNGVRNVTEKRLFHGTDSKYVDVICHTNFDWRICGTHGTAFGKGSYFARDAKYSHNYTGDSDVKSMFISRLLVGDYTKGSPEYRRPPSKDGGDINFFDSCVDDIMNPSIYVVFEKHQIYPEYLLQYKATHPLVDLYGAASVPAPKPVPAPRPAPQPSVSVYPSRTTSYQPIASFHQPIVATPRPSTVSYSSSTSSYRFQPTQPAASPPPQTAKKQSDSCVIA